MTTRPHLLVNMAMTADGKIDTVARGGARISGAADSARVDQLRAAADAVMVGGRTLLGEDPGLTVRDPELRAARERGGRPSQPAKVAIVSRIDRPGDPDALPLQSEFLDAGGGQVVICTTTRTDAATQAWLEDRGVIVVVHGDVRVDLAAALGALRELGIEQLMVEGGSTLVAALLEAGQVDELHLAVAPMIFGGESAPTPVGGPGWAPEEARRLRLEGVTTSADDDVILRYSPLLVGA